MKKKILAFLITSILTLSLIPFTALASMEFEGSGTSDDPYLIKTADEFVYLLNNPNTNAYYKLVNDIDMSSKSWTVGISEIPGYIVDNPVTGSQFNGTLDGNGKTVSNISKTTLVTDSDNHDLLGLFGTIGANGCVKNLVINNFYLEGTNNVGAIAALNLGTIINCAVVNSKIVSDEISCTDKDSKQDSKTAFSGGESGAGGIAGFNLGIIKNCSVDNLTNDRGGPHLGGICGYNQGIIYGCESKNLKTINVDTRLKEYITGAYFGGCIGGIAGINSTNQLLISPTHATIENCTNYSDINNTSSSGGICGWNKDATIKDCVNHGNIKISSIIEDGNKPGANAGGIAGDMWQTMIDQEVQIIHCANFGDVEGTIDVGGITGCAYNMSYNNLLLVSDCLNQGNVVANNRAAGIVGKSDATIVNCFNTGNVTLKGEYNGIDDYYVGGISAVSNNGIEFCGNSGTVSSEITTGKVHRFAVIGGIAGQAFYSPIEHSYNIAPVLCTLSKEKWEKKGLSLGGIVGGNNNSSLTDNYFAKDVKTDAEFSNGIDTASDNGISAAKMRGLQAKETMPGLFGEDSPFETSDNFEIDGVFYATSPFIPAAFMDKTTIAVVDHVVPATSDSNSYILWIVLMVLSMIAIALTSRELIIKKFK